MSIIKLPLLFESSKGEKILMALFDFGTTFSCISPDFAASLATLEKMRRPMEIGTAAIGSYLRI